MKPFYKFNDANYLCPFVSEMLVEAIGVGKDNAIPYYKTSFDVAEEKRWYPEDTFGPCALIDYELIGLPIFIFFDERGEKMVSLISNEEEKNEMLDAFHNDFVKTTERLTERIKSGNPVDVRYGSNMKGYIFKLLRVENELRKIRV